MPIYLLQKIKPEECETGESIRMVVVATGVQSARKLAHLESSNIEKEDEDWLKEDVTKCHDIGSGLPFFNQLEELTGLDRFDGPTDSRRVICHERKP